jgi:DNA-binding GntR family transcriptional regulator
MERRMLEGQRQDQELWKQCDWDFHHSLISACGSDVLLAAHAAAYDRYLRYQMIAVVFRGEIAAREHQELLQTALVRDWKRAQTIMVSHIRGCVEHALEEDNAGLFGSLPKSQRTVVKSASSTQSDRKPSRQSAKASTSSKAKA